MLKLQTLDAGGGTRLSLIDRLVVAFDSRLFSAHVENCHDDKTMGKCILSLLHLKCDLIINSKSKNKSQSKITFKVTNQYTLIQSNLFMEYRHTSSVIYFTVNPRKKPEYYQNNQTNEIRMTIKKYQSNFKVSKTIQT